MMKVEIILLNENATMNNSENELIKQILLQDFFEQKPLLKKYIVEIVCEDKEITSELIAEALQNVGLKGRVYSSPVE